MSDFIFGTKAETLSFLYKNIKKDEVRILHPFYFDVENWKTEKAVIVEQVLSAFNNSRKLIVRSSALSEDSTKESLAGKYESIICDNDRLSLEDTVNRVIESYGDANDKDQVLIQKAIDNIECAGVVFSRDPNTGGAYYVINYDDKTGSSSSVTSGTGTDTKLFYWFSKSSKRPDDRRLDRVCKMTDELRDMLGRDSLDIEFLFSEDILYILQARPLIVKTELKDIGQQDRILTRIHNKIKLENREKPYLCGRRTIYGVMPDWNPAEMIGIHPRNLATSIYKEIITDDVWAYQRDNYGYKKLRSFPLMVDFCGYPYIDVRVSFNSFIPADLDEEIAEKLVNYYLDRLEEAPHKHDKVEFDIIFSCYTFDLPKRISILKEYGFSQKEIDEITDSLRNLTNKIMDNDNGLWKKDSDKLRILEERRNRIEDSDLNSIEKAFWLLEDCKRYGTLPFAGLARAGFIAVQLLKSMVSEGIITRDENEAFMNDLQTVGSQMKNDYSVMDKNTFLKKYGFLRPGTYDICSLRYDEAAETYFDWEKKDYVSENKSSDFRLSLLQMERIRDTLELHGMEEDVLGLFSFIKGAIEGREKAKFAFTRNVSDILKLLGDWGENLGFSREQLSYTDIKMIKSMYNGAVDECREMEKSISEGQEKYSEGIGIVLPPIIVNEDCIYSFHVPDSQPNYITQKKISGAVCRDITKEKKDLEGKILLIESADPGFDWIFSHPIKGFITKYGGANSHMAIRAGELSIPAIVGVGSKVFDKVYSAQSVEVDCANRTIKVLS